MSSTGSVVVVKRMNSQANETRPLGTQYSDDGH